MANVKITQLPTATTPLTGTEVFPLVQGTTTKQVAITGLFTSPVMTNPTLGTVGQADLINATGLPISTGVAGLGTGVATFLGTPSSSNLRAAVTDETGTGSLVFATSPTLVTPNLGTPTAMVATNITGTALGLIAGSAITNANLTGAVTSVGNATSLGSFTSAQLATALTDETGSGSAVFATSPTLVTPALGTPSALVGTNITGTASGLTAGNVTTNANLTGAVTSVGNATSLGSFTSAQLATALTDETGTGANVFATSPTLVTPILGTPTSATLTNATGLPLTTGVTGILSTANGGTNLTSFTSGGVVFASSTSALETRSSLAFDGLNFNVGGTYSASQTNVIEVNNRQTGATKSATGISLISDSGGIYTSAFYVVAGSNTRYNLMTGSPTTVVFYTNNTEGMRLTSTGLGIGTSSPQASLHVAGAISSAPNGSGFLAGLQGNYAVAHLNGSDGGIVDFSVSGTDTRGRIIYTNSTNAMGFGTTDGVTKMTLDGSGNLGLGVTPSAWISSYRTFSLGDSGFISSRIGASVNNLESGVNWFRNSGGSFIYKANGFATNYGQQDGQHIWYNAPNNTSGASAALTFTQAMTLDASGNLLVGTTSNSGSFRLRVVTTGTAGAIFQGSEYVQVIVTDGTRSMYQQIYNNEARFFTSTSTPLLFGTNDTERARIPAAGGFQSVGSISVGNATPTTSGAGITFPATQSASSDANTLDDYEEGTWTPALSGASGSSGITYTARSGSYVKIGRQVTCKGSVVLSGKTSITGGVVISGFPFGTENVDSVTPVNFGYFANLGANTWTQVYGYMGQNQSMCYLGGKATAGTSFTNFADADITSTTRIDFVSIYFV